MSEPSKKGIRAEGQLALGVRVQVLKRVSTWDEGKSNQAWELKPERERVFMGKGLPTRRKRSKEDEKMVAFRETDERRKNFKDNKKQVSHCERKDLKYVE